MESLFHIMVYFISFYFIASRCHRLGQDKTVLVLRLVSVGPETDMHVHKGGDSDMHVSRGSIGSKQSNNSSSNSNNKSNENNEDGSKKIKTKISRIVSVEEKMQRTAGGKLQTEKLVLAQV